jgi:hypothetical protein
MAKSGHSVGKTHLAAVAINWFFDCQAPCAVISTAPTARDVRDVLWKEVRMQRQRAGLADVFVGPSAPEMRTGPDHYAKGFTARRGESLQGRHDLRMLLVMDEAVGISPIFWQTFASMFKPEAGHAWLAICNPTETTSEAYAQESDSGMAETPSWHTYTLSALDHPNIAAELAGRPPPIPAAVTLQQVNQWVEEWTEPIDREQDEITPEDLEWPPKSGKWHRPGPVFQARCQGVWPTMGTQGVWSESLWETVTAKRLPLPIEILPEIGADIAYHGADWTAFFVRWGPCGMHHEEHNGWDHVRTAKRLKALADEYAALVTKHREPQAKPIEGPQIRIKVDDDGTGGGVVSILRSWGYSVVGVNAAGRAARAGYYPNKRSELWFDTRDRARSGQLDLTRLSKSSLRRLKSQAMVVEYEVVQGRRVCEPKDITKAKCGRSPDSADSMNLGYYSGTDFVAPPILEEAGRPNLYQRVFGGK